MYQSQTFTTEYKGKIVKAEFSNMADRATQSVLLQCDKTVILATFVISRRVGLGNFLPFRVDFEEKYYAGGHIFGSRYSKREGRPSTNAVLRGRIVDRTVRPLFDQTIRSDMQLILTVLSLGGADIEEMSVLAASLVLSTSGISWGGPVAASKNTDNGKELLVCGTESGVVMIECGAPQVSDEEVVSQVETCWSELQHLVVWQKEIIVQMEVVEHELKRIVPRETVVEYFEEHVKPLLITEFAQNPVREDRLSEIGAEFEKACGETVDQESASEASIYFEKQLDEMVHSDAQKKGIRVDGRGFDEIRELYAKVAPFETQTHGMGLFYRGGTHVLSTLTLGGPESEEIAETMDGESKSRFLHHYNFPPYSVGETGNTAPNRRALGHGALAHKALSYVIPPQELFPYTVRLVSEVLSSNGSSSMGSVCASTLALMDGGVPIIAPVAGIAMGLFTFSDSTYKVLTDVQGFEDHYGDMDFKVAGTRSGITAIQLDIKVSSISIKIVKDAIMHAKSARISILDVIESEIQEPRKELSPYAPSIETMHISPEKIGLVIGSSGKTITEIKHVSKVTEITIEDSGDIFIIAPSKEYTRKARLMIEGIVHEYSVGDQVNVTVVKILEFGALASFGFNKEGLIHISEFSPQRIEKVDSVVKVGDALPAVIKEIKDGKIRLSVKEADPHLFSYVKE